ncbi:MAG TPA: hypothetical protein VMB79_12540 [Jatrophihabitans sp.]|nr:hypothetical protein [Jatrophihabitans sp.]
MRTARTFADGRHTFCNACNLSVVNSFGIAASYDAGADLAARRGCHDVPDRLRFFSICDDTEYASGDHMELLTGFLQPRNRVHRPGDGRIVDTEYTLGANVMPYNR